MVKPTIAARFCWLLGVGWAAGFGLAMAQPAPAPGITLPLNDLSAFTASTSNWRIAGNVRADLNKANILTTEKGTGILVNVPLANAPTDAKNPYKYDLVTAINHGDVDLELDYMMASQSNSGCTCRAATKCNCATVGMFIHPMFMIMGPFMNDGTKNGPKVRKAMKATLPARMPAVRPVCGSI